MVLVIMMVTVMVGERSVDGRRQENTRKIKRRHERAKNKRSERGTGASRGRKSNKKSCEGEPWVAEDQ
jgi:hypothetical protein